MPRIDATRAAAPTAPLRLATHHAKPWPSYVEAAPPPGDSSAAHGSLAHRSVVAQPPDKPATSRRNAANSEAVAAGYPRICPGARWATAHARGWPLLPMPALLCPAALCTPPGPQIALPSTLIRLAGAAAEAQPSVARVDELRHSSSSWSAETRTCPALFAAARLRGHGPGSRASNCRVPARP